MQINRGFYALCVSALLVASLAADVTVKDLGDGNAELTFTFSDKASEMGVIGSFDNWTTPGEPMTKAENGLWTATVTAKITDEVQYKFYSQGTWILDPNAPDVHDDGNGGKNGLVLVADVLAGKVPVASPEIAGKAVVAKNARPKTQFHTATYIESNTVATVSPASTDFSSSVLDSRSLWKFEGDFIPGMPGFLEMTVFDGTAVVAAPNATTPVTLEKGLENLSAGLLFNPFFYLSDGVRPELDKFRFGFETPVVSYETGYAFSTLPARKSILWDTVTNNSIAAVAGYSSFRLGKDLRTWGDVEIDVGIVPNAALNNLFGLYAFANLGWNGLVLDAQYEMKASSKVATEYFSNMSRQNIIVGVAGILEGFSLKGQFLYSLFSAGGSIDALSPAKKMAGKVVLGYRDDYDDLNASLSYTYRGSGAAQFLFANTADNDRVLGKASGTSSGLHNLEFDLRNRFDYVNTAKLSGGALLSTVNPVTSNIALSLTPGWITNFGAIPLFPVTVEVQARLVVNTVADLTNPAFALASSAARFSFGELVPNLITAADATYSLSNGYVTTAGSTKTVEGAFHSLMGAVHFGPELELQAALGYRSATTETQPLGFSLGIAYTVPAPELKSPTLYVQVVDNLDPYGDKADKDFVSPSTLSYSTDGFAPSKGAAGSYGLAALRAGIAWNF